MGGSVLSTNLCLLIGVFRPFILKVIIGMLELKPAFLLFVFCLFPICCSTVSLCLPSCGMLEHFLGFLIDLFILFLSICLLTVLFVVNLNTTLHILKL